MLDAAAQSQPALQEYQAQFSKWKQLTAELDDLTNAERASEQELELLRFQIEEIDAAQIRPEEEENILQRYKIASNSTKLAEITGQILGTLAEADDAVLNRLNELRRHLRELEKTDRQTATMTQGFESAVVELEELEQAIRSYQEDLDFNPKEIYQINLTDLPVVNRAFFAKPFTAQDFCAAHVEVNFIKSINKYLKKRKELLEAAVAGVDEEKAPFERQAHDASAVRDFYVAPELQIKIAKCSTIPTVNDKLLAKLDTGSKLTLSESLMLEIHTAEQQDRTRCYKLAMHEDQVVISFVQ